MLLRLFSFSLSLLFFCEHMQHDDTKQDALATGLYFK